MRLGGMSDAPHPPHWIGPVCPACSVLLPKGAPLSPQHVGARPELQVNDPQWSRRTVILDGETLHACTEVVPGWRRGDTLVVVTRGPACRCGKANPGSLYAIVESGRVVVA